MRILIAEDEPLTAKIAAHILEHAGYHVDVVYDGELAHERLQHRSYDLLLLDWMMPEMDGIQLVRTIRTEMTPMPKVVLMSGLADDQARKHALEAGAHALVAKPFSPDDLLGAVRDCLQEQVEAEPPKRSPVSPLRKPVRPPFPAICVIGENRCTCLSRFLAGLPNDLRAAVFVAFQGEHTPIADLQEMSTLPLQAAGEGRVVEPGNVYVPPAGMQLVILGNPLTTHLEEPLAGDFDVHAADTLTRSVARAFGSFTILVVLCSHSYDGLLGARHVSACEGTIIGDATHYAHAGYLAHAVGQAGIGARFVERREVAPVVTEHVQRLLHNTLTQKLAIETD